MPDAALRFCQHPGCSELVSNGKCSKHRTARVQRVGSAASRGYDATWRKFRLWFLKHNPFCNDCGYTATEVHHKHKLRDGGVRLDPNNCMSLCMTCHRRRTARGE